MIERGSALLIADYHDKDDALKSLRHKNIKEVLTRHIKDVDYSILLGDNFNSNSPSYLLVKELCELLLPFREYYNKFVVCNGNHDSLGLITSPLHTFCLGARIIHAASQEIIESPFVFRGWNTAKPGPCPSRSNFFTRFYCGHVALAFPPYLVGASRYSPEVLSKLGYDAMFLGDFHHPRDFGNIHSIGTFAPVNFSDTNLKACYGLLEWNTTDYKLTRHYLDYPVYKIIKVNYSHDLFDIVSKLNTEILNNCVRIDVTDSGFVDNEFKNKLQKLIESYHPFSYKIDYLPKVEIEKKVNISTESVGKFIDDRTNEWPKEAREYFNEHRSK